MKYILMKRPDKNAKPTICNITGLEIRKPQFIGWFESENFITASKEIKHIKKDFYIQPAFGVGLEIEIKYQNVPPNWVNKMVSIP